MDSANPTRPAREGEPTRRAVLIGRPYVYGLAIAGEDGVREVLRNLVAEFDLTLGLAGCASVSELGRDSLTWIA